MTARVKGGQPRRASVEFMGLVRGYGRKGATDPRRRRGPSLSREAQRFIRQRHEVARRRARNRVARAQRRAQRRAA